MDVDGGREAGLERRVDGGIWPIRVKARDGARRAIRVVRIGRCIVSNGREVADLGGEVAAVKLENRVTERS